MKHNLKITFLLILLFFAAHVIGLVVLDSYQVKEYPYGFTPPEIEHPIVSLVDIVVTIAIITVIVLLLVRFRARRLWRLWFFISLVVTLLLGFSAFIPKEYALGLAFGLALWRVLKNNVYLHNFTEMFVYGGLASLFVPILNLVGIIVLLIVISVYDYWAVFKSKHMIKMAKFQSENKVFAGLFIPYGRKTAILGGGDIGFTLLFSGVIFMDYGFIPALITSLFAAGGLLLLLMLGRKNRYYPAMPFLTAGCFFGFGVVYLLHFFGVA